MPPSKTFAVTPSASKLYLLNAVDNNLFNVELGSRRESFEYLERAEAHFHLGHYEQALADLARAVELKPDVPSHLTTEISPDLVASCPDEKFRAGMLALADKVIERTRDKAGG
jgi:hypothetical protein